MSSAKLISAFRAVSQQAQLTCRPANALRTSFRSFSHTPPYRMPSPSQMPDVANTASPIGQPEKSWTGDTDIALRAITSQPLPNPYSGRTVAVTKSLGDSLKALDGILARNKVKYELRSAERHENSQSLCHLFTLIPITHDLVFGVSCYAFPFSCSFLDTLAVDAGYTSGEPV